MVDKAAAAESALAPGQCGLAEAVARYLFKLMAFKDEYEVARLYTDGNFLKQVGNELGGDNLRFEFHLAPPLLAKIDSATGLPRKMSFGPWMMGAFGLLAKFKFLRGTKFDIFGRHKDRVTERALIAEYEQAVETVLKLVSKENYGACVELLNLPDMIRGYGPVKAQNLAAVKAEEAALLARFRSKEAAMATAAE